MTRYAFRRYDQFETCPEAIEQELRPAVIVLMILCSYVTLHTWFVFGVDTYLVLYCDVGHRVPPFSRNEETVSTGSKLQHSDPLHYVLNCEGALCERAQIHTSVHMHDTSVCMHVPAFTRTRTHIDTYTHIQ